MSSGDITHHIQEKVKEHKQKYHNKDWRLRLERYDYEEPKKKYCGLNIKEVYR